MKRILKIAAWLLGSLGLLALLGIAYISIKGVPTYPVSIPADILALRVPRDSAHVAQGAKIASLLCNECHKNAETTTVRQASNT